MDMHINNYTILQLLRPDYLDISVNFTIPINQADDLCANVIIERDNVLEDSELFLADLQSETVEICEVGQAHVVISDSTRKKKKKKSTGSIVVPPPLQISIILGAFYTYICNHMTNLVQYIYPHRE